MPHKHATMRLMACRLKAAFAAVLLAATMGSAFAQPEAVQGQVALARQALERSERAIESNDVVAAFNSAREARRLLETALTDARGAGRVQDERSDRLHQAVDQVAEVERALNQITAPPGEHDRQAVLGQLAEVESLIRPID